jgi:hypothetical protein
VLNVLFGSTVPLPTDSLSIASPESGRLSRRTDYEKDHSKMLFPFRPVVRCGRAGNVLSFAELLQKVSCRNTKNFSNGTLTLNHRSQYIPCDGRSRFFSDENRHEK